MRWVLAGVFLLGACATVQTPEQEAYRLCGVYTVTAESGARLVADPAVPDAAKDAIRDATRRAWPVAQVACDGIPTTADPIWELVTTVAEAIQ